MINPETFKPISQICEIDPEEIRFKEAVNSWVEGEINYEQLIKKYPSYLLDFPQRIIRKISEIFTIE